MEFRYFYLSLAAISTVRRTQGKTISLTNPEVIELANDSLLKIGKGAQLIEITEAETEVGAKNSYIMIVLFFCFILLCLVLGVSYIYNL